MHGPAWRVVDDEEGGKAGIGHDKVSPLVAPEEPGRHPIMHISRPEKIAIYGETALSEVSPATDEYAVSKRTAVSSSVW